MFGKWYFQKVPNSFLNYSLCSLFNGMITFWNLDPFQMENVQYYLRKVWIWFTTHDFFSPLYTFSMVTFLWWTHIFFLLKFSRLVFLSGLQIKSNRYIAELSDIIFCAYSTMYWIMLAHVLLLLFSPDWERMTVGAINSHGFQHHWLNQERCSG